MKCCDVTSGMLRTTVEFQRITRTADGAGGWAETWAAIPDAPSRAWVRGASGFERLQAGRLDAQTTDRLTCRYFAGLTAADRVLVDGAAYNIQWVDNVERRNRWLDMRLAGGVAT